mmetsp:Transcript_12031/g.31660  ORF Transcript_12031/g.31660 Transcript_12031/m.31660 type:complete len:294 (+) Transcript_12031:234-1115(+)
MRELCTPGSAASHAPRARAVKALPNCGSMQANACPVGDARPPGPPKWCTASALMAHVQGFTCRGEAAGLWGGGGGEGGHMASPIRPHMINASASSRDCTPAVSSAEAARASRSDSSKISSLAICNTRSSKTSGLSSTCPPCIMSPFFTSHERCMLSTASLQIMLISWSGSPLAALSPVDHARGCSLCSMCTRFEMRRLKGVAPADTTARVAARFCAMALLSTTRASEVLRLLGIVAGSAPCSTACKLCCWACTCFSSCGHSTSAISCKRSTSPSAAESAGPPFAGGLGWGALP